MNNKDQNDDIAMAAEMNRRLQEIIDQKRTESEALKKILISLSKLDKEIKTNINNK